ncbi:unnamed protein product [Aphanomyces euteiches]
MGKDTFVPHGCLKRGSPPRTPPAQLPVNFKNYCEKTNDLPGHGRSLCILHSVHRASKSISFLSTKAALLGAPSEPQTTTFWSGIGDGVGSAKQTRNGYNVECDQDRI